MEIFKDVLDYEGVYQVSNLGNVKSKKFKKERILKPGCRDGYPYVVLSKNKKARKYSIHRLVASAFISNPDCKAQVNHVNCIKNDNSVENLEWCSNQENRVHAVKNNLNNENTCEKHHMSKLTNFDVKKARKLHSQGLSNTSLSRKYKVTSTAMSNILRKLTYKEI